MLILFPYSFAMQSRVALRSFRDPAYRRGGVVSGMPYIREGSKSQIRVRCLDASSARLAKVVQACAACQPELEFVPSNGNAAERNCNVAAVGLALAAACP